MTLRPDKDAHQQTLIYYCSNCGHKEKLKERSLKEKTEDELANSPQIKVVGEKEEKLNSLPTTKMECPKCGHNEAFWWFLQTRSGDEPPTQFYRCVKCNHTWRSYS